MVESPEYDSVEELHTYFSDLLEKKRSKPCKANEVRTFVEDLATELGDTKLAVYILYKTFIRTHPDIPIDKPYFEDIVTRAWKSFIVNDTLYIDASKLITSKKNLRRRRF